MATSEQPKAKRTNDFEKMVPGHFRGDFAFLNFDPEKGLASLFQRAEYQGNKKDSFVRYDLDGLKKLQVRLRAVIPEMIAHEKKKLQALSEDA